ncbi:MAG: hypothetical protein QXD89_01070 [Candidatus Aenigmatarchaeota archaeon]
MRGISTETIILIAAILFVAALIVLFWVKGIGPFSVGISESECKTNILKACNGELKWDKVNDFCSSYYVGALQTNLKTCLESDGNDQAACDDFCNMLLTQ